MIFWFVTDDCLFKLFKIGGVCKISKQNKQTKQANFDNEIKKIKQEIHHAEKMSNKWNDTLKRKRNKLVEVNQLAILDCCEKNSLDYGKLRQVLATLPPLEELLKEKQEKYEEQPSEESTLNFDENQDSEVDSSFLKDEFVEIIESQEDEEQNESETMEQTGF